MIDRRSFLIGLVAAFVPKPATGPAMIVYTLPRAKLRYMHIIDVGQIDDFKFFFRKWLAGLGPPKAMLE